MRAVFGPYLVMNINEYQIDFRTWNKVDSTTTTFVSKYVTEADANQQILGAYEFYWWPYKNFLLSRLSDGTSFRIWRFANNFETVAAAESSQKFAERIS